MNSAPRPTANYLGAYRRQLIAEDVPDDLADAIVADLARRLHDQLDVHILADADADAHAEAESFMNDVLDGLTTPDPECSPNSSAG